MTQQEASTIQYRNKSNCERENHRMEQIGVWELKCIFCGKVEDTKPEGDDQ